MTQLQDVISGTRFLSGKWLINSSQILTIGYICIFSCGFIWNRIFAHAISLDDNIFTFFPLSSVKAPTLPIPGFQTFVSSTFVLKVAQFVVLCQGSPGKQMKYLIKVCIEVTSAHACLTRTSPGYLRTRLKYLLSISSKSLLKSKMAERIGINAKADAKRTLMIIQL